MEEADADDAVALDLARKRKADEDNQNYVWLDDPRVFEVRRKQYELDQDAKRKNEAASSKMIKGAEAKVIAADAHIKIAKGNAEADAIRLNAEGKRRIDDAKAAKLEFELEQMKIAAGIDTNAKKPTTSKHETPQERARKDAKNKKAREDRVKNRTSKNNAPTSPKADA